MDSGSGSGSIPRGNFTTGIYLRLKDFEKLNIWFLNICRW